MKEVAPEQSAEPKPGAAYVRFVRAAQARGQHRESVLILGRVARQRGITEAAILAELPDDLREQFEVKKRGGQASGPAP